ncbi:Holliday junction resolvase RuvX [Corynebacterium sp. 320]|uniref:Holliday junction resolvase RuvX n=1 Tax=Corynebacterium TaxID=1716 RepID=UPI00125CA5F7|nr:MULTISPECIES: Holliday junction resolvase RuvX [Corynebacterium]KAB1503712.1 Holliday junction resolvase RuvX [Corynebacterium sp. 320]KAB1553187.1 Holliday junction resolvase RuvX [Corynebacterium sp. 321]KAB1553594.1 Holliday junction resolvase RuvX [Corynebacterium sp. 319]KAB3527848.1 Holliday junction resolvase RuvX [Corynebacterium sp. 250]KAB3540663.1 Holliday junction resolvase RuvX [Corynebacterium sp. 366]
MAETQRPSRETDPGRGRRLGLDVGSVRIGVALSDPDCILASPLETVKASIDSSDVQRVAALVEENFVVEVIVGLPVALRGNHTSSTLAAEEFARDLSQVIGDIPVRMVDERMSTMAATQAMQASGVSAKKGRSRIDQAAAVHILQGWLDARRRVMNEEL